MNGRFTRLEFDDESRHKQVSQQGAAGVPLRTAAHDMLDADTAYRAGLFDPALQSYTRALKNNRALIPAWVGQVQMLVELAEYREARLWSDKALELFRNNGDLLAAKSRACFRQRDRAAAISCSDASLESPGSSPQRWQARGEIMLQRSAARARDCFERSFTDPGADWFDRTIVARVYLFYDEAARAIEYARAATQMQPAHAYCWYILGQCQESIGWSGEAAVSYSRCLELDQGHKPAGAALVTVQNLSTSQRASRWLKGLFRR
jgi:tetratricopeptide (TPR) repeat protein